MNPSVEQMLRDHYVNSVLYTHVSLVQPRGKFLFSRQDLEDFWEVYCDKIKDGNGVMGMAEKSQHYLPVLADIDLKIKDSEEFRCREHLYTPEHVLKVIQIYQSVLRNIVEDCTDDFLICVLLEKPMYNVVVGDVTYIKNGFHLHFPNIFLNKIDQEVQLIPRVQDIMEQMEVFLDIGIQKSANTVDKACCTVPWLMYGSRKSENMEPYKVTKVFDSDVSEISLEKAFKNYRLYDINEKVIDIRGKVTKYLPRILSIIPYGRAVQEVKRGLTTPLKEKIEETKNQKTKTHIKVSVEELLKMSAKLLPMIADWRAVDRNEWMTIGWVLFNIGEGCHIALDQWLEFSSRDSEKYDEAKCVYEWERMVKKDLSVGTLKYYASIDSPDLYKEFKQAQSNNFIKESLNGSHNDIAKVLYSEYSNEFVCASISNKTWYQFDNHRWVEMEEGTYLREKISSEVVEKYIEQGKHLFSKLSVTTDKAEEAMYNARLKQVQNIIGKLKTSPFKSSVMKEAMEVFYDRRFKNKLDQNPYLIGFKNGVYDLKLNEFRNGRPEDFISKVLPIEYKQYNENDPEVQNIVEFLIKIFPDKDLREYFLNTYCDIFVGGNNKKKIYMWTGEGGDNGKSITQLAFEKMLGEFSVKFQTQYFTGKKVSTGSANPELARAAPPVRLVMMEEPDGDEQLNIGELKKLSGGDSFWARDLFERGKSVKEVFPLFMLTFVCNKLPKIKLADKASWNRFRVIPFESTFVEPPDECPVTFEEQIQQKRFPMDRDFNNKIPDMVEAFAWYLINWRKNVKKGKINEPLKVLEATALYRRQNDVCRQFTEECLIKDSAVITISELYAKFRDWFREGWPSSSLPIKNEIRDYFIKQWGEPEKGVYWTGYRIRTLADDMASGDIVVLGEKDLVNYDGTPPL